MVPVWPAGRDANTNARSAQAPTLSSPSVGRNIDARCGAHTVRLLARACAWVGGIAKAAFASDEACGVMRTFGVERALVDGRRNHVGRAPPDCTGWSIALVPFADEVDATRSSSRHAGVATSATESQRSEDRGARYRTSVRSAHPDRLSRAAPAASVTRAGQQTADALANRRCACFGNGRGLALIAATAGQPRARHDAERRALQELRSPGFPALDAARRRLDRLPSNFAATSERVSNL